MEASFHHSLAPKPLQLLAILTPKHSRPNHSLIFFPPTLHRRTVKINPVNSASGDNSNSPTPQVPPPITPPETVEIRFRRRSRRRQRQEGGDDGASAGRQPWKAEVRSDAPKKWEEMSIAEKAVEVYMGEKGLLFWLNKFAYASIFIVIGGWILFRFVGPSLNLYQLESPPLSPTSIFKGS